MKLVHKTTVFSKRSYPVWIGAFVAVTILTFSCCSPVSSADTTDNWIVNVIPTETLNLNPGSTQWFSFNGQLNAVSLIDGKIAVFSQNNGVWAETHQLGPADINFTAFCVKDFNSDSMPEIIAGTTEPGFIYIYKLSDQTWVLDNYGKYVWSTVTQIAVGSFAGSKTNDILVQNQEGSLFLLKKNNNSFDLIWKSPKLWRLISSIMVLDIDNDSKDEIMVVYKTGGIGILKVINNSIVSVWENYLWGKVMAITSGYLDNDKQPELLLSTSQKVIYLLGYTSDKGYQFKDHSLQFDFIVEKSSFQINHGKNQLLMTDTAGKTHLLEYVAQNKQWQEKFTGQTGRIAQIITKSDGSILMWGFNRDLMALDMYKADVIKLKLQDIAYELTPPAIFQNDRLYVAPQALFLIPDIPINYNYDKSVFQIGFGPNMIEINKNKLEAINVNGESQTNPDRPLVIGDILYLPVESYQKLLNMELTFDRINRTLNLTGDFSES